MVPASLHGAPACAGTVRIWCIPIHPIDRQAQIHHRNRNGGALQRTAKRLRAPGPPDQVAAHGQAPAGPAGPAGAEGYALT